MNPTTRKILRGIAWVLGIIAIIVMTFAIIDTLFSLGIVDSVGHSLGFQECCRC